MPIPNFDKERKYLNVLRMLHDEGVDVEIEDDLVRWVEPIEIDIAPPPDNEVFDRASGGLSYALWVRLLSHRRCMIENISITVPFDSAIVLESPDKRHPIGMYGYPPVLHSEVLNHRIKDGLKFARAGELVKGLLVATGVARFPQGYWTGQLLPVTLTMTDQFGTEIVKSGQLFIQHEHGAVRKPRMPRTDLFGQYVSSCQNHEVISTATLDGQPPHVGREGVATAPADSRSG